MAAGTLIDLAVPPRRQVRRKAPPTECGRRRAGTRESRPAPRSSAADNHRGPKADNHPGRKADNHPGPNSMGASLFNRC
ncbi:hypothetical protein J2Z21_000017 [Streptomyces griseochromogenes]|uniref:Transposase n=1 Tax=Streptomyces griseochromogenes TaxID=68214 RepID=A0ABS4LI84_9ACTN|nr:hypothetical protein [Streptomyces griseochromogenes]